MTEDQRHRFDVHLKDAMKWQGLRVSDATQSDEPDVVAAAIAMSVLNNLRVFSQMKPLYPKDIERAMEAFREAAGVVGEEGPMGEITFRRA